MEGNQRGSSGGRDATRARAPLNDKGAERITASSSSLRLPLRFDTRRSDDRAIPRCDDATQDSSPSLRVRSIVETRCIRRAAPRRLAAWRNERGERITVLGSMLMAMHRAPVLPGIAGKSLARSRSIHSAFRIAGSRTVPISMTLDVPRVNGPLAPLDDDSLSLSLYDPKCQGNKSLKLVIISQPLLRLRKGDNERHKPRFPRSLTSLARAIVLARYTRTCTYIYVIFYIALS